MALSKWGKSVSASMAWAINGASVGISRTQAELDLMSVLKHSIPRAFSIREKYLAESALADTQRNAPSGALGT